MVIRKIKTDDAVAFLNLCHQLDKETQFMLLEPDERTTSVDEQIVIIENILSRNNKIIFVAEDNNQLIGYISAYGGDYKRNRHNVNIVIGIIQAYTGQGIGIRLFEELEKWAYRNKIHRLELTVMVHNKAAIALYKKNWV